MDTNFKINQIMKARGWTEYKLAKESGLSQSTIANLFRRNTEPSIATLKVICHSLGLTLSQFFAEDGMVELTAEQFDLFDKWATLTSEQKDLLYKLIKNMK